MNDEDSKLISSVLDGSQSGFRLLVEKYQRLVYHIVSKMVPEAEHEDLCQDVFLKVYKNLSGFQQQSKLSTWIGRIAHNSCLNYLEKKKVVLYDDITSEEQTIDSVASDHSSPEESALASDLGARIRQEIDSLPVKYGTILVLYHLEDMKYDEIGTIMQLPPGTVKSHLFRARKMLKDKLLLKYNIEDISL
ncbi:MAG: sigma-70 family RNA polymerase sigma factor [bacterium]|nr:sigma-70 family RNA polymerase sigma factor [bacterium]